MTDVTWPPPNPAAEELLRRLLNLISPGWTLRPWADLDGNEILTLLWHWTPAFKGRGEPSTSWMGEIALDRALERTVEGAALDLLMLNPDAQSAFHARLAVAMAGASAAMLSLGPVMRLPRGLDEEQRRQAVTLRLLYGAPLSIQGLD